MTQVSQLRYTEPTDIIVSIQTTSNGVVVGTNGQLPVDFNLLAHSPSSVSPTFNIADILTPSFRLQHENVSNCDLEKSAYSTKIPPTARTASKESLHPSNAEQSRFRVDPTSIIPNRIDNRTMLQSDKQYSHLNSATAELCSRSYRTVTDSPTSLHMRRFDAQCTKIPVIPSIDYTQLERKHSPPPQKRSSSKLSRSEIFQVSITATRSPDNEDLIPTSSVSQSPIPISFSTPPPPSTSSSSSSAKTMTSSIGHCQTSDSAVSFKGLDNLLDATRYALAEAELADAEALIDQLVNRFAQPIDLCTTPANVTTGEGVSMESRVAVAAGTQDPIEDDRCLHALLDRAATTTQTPFLLPYLMQLPVQYVLPELCKQSEAGRQLQELCNQLTAAIRRTKYKLRVLQRVRTRQARTKTTTTNQERSITGSMKPTSCLDKQQDRRSAFLRQLGDIWPREGHMPTAWIEPFAFPISTTPAPSDWLTRTNWPSPVPSIYTSPTECPLSLLSFVSSWDRTSDEAVSCAVSRESNPASQYPQEASTSSGMQFSHQLAVEVSSNSPQSDHSSAIHIPVSWSKLLDSKPDSIRPIDSQPGSMTPCSVFPSTSYSLSPSSCSTNSCGPIMAPSSLLIDVLDSPNGRERGRMKPQGRRRSSVAQPPRRSSVTKRRGSVNSVKSAPVIASPSKTTPSPSPSIDYTNLYEPRSTQRQSRARLSTSDRPTALSVDTADSSEATRRESLTSPSCSNPLTPTFPMSSIANCSSWTSHHYSIATGHNPANFSEKIPDSLMSTTSPSLTNNNTTTTPLEKQPSLSCWSHHPRPPTPDLRRSDLDCTDLSDGLRVLVIEQMHLRSGTLYLDNQSASNTSSSPSLETRRDQLFRIHLDADRSSSQTTTTTTPMTNHPQTSSSGRNTSFVDSLTSHQPGLTQIPPNHARLGGTTPKKRRQNDLIIYGWQVVQQAVLEVVPASIRHLPPGTRVCAAWSEQLASNLYPGTVVEVDQTGQLLRPGCVAVDFDDGDHRQVPVHHIRMLPDHFTNLYELTEATGSQDWMIPLVNMPSSRSAMDRGQTTMGSDYGSTRMKPRTRHHSAMDSRVPSMYSLSRSTGYGKRVWSEQESPICVKRLSEAGQPPKLSRQSGGDIMGTLEEAVGQNSYTPTDLVGSSSHCASQHRLKREFMELDIPTDDFHSGRGLPTLSPPLLLPSPSSSGLRLDHTTELDGAETAAISPSIDHEFPSDTLSSSSSVHETHRWRILRRIKRRRQGQIYCRSIIREADGLIVSIGDTVEFSSGQDEVYLGDVQEIRWNEATESLIVTASWFYNPGEAGVEGELVRGIEGALFATTHVDENEAKCLVRRVTILPSYAAYRKRWKKEGRREDNTTEATEVALMLGQTRAHDTLSDNSDLDGNIVADQTPTPLLSFETHYSEEATSDQPVYFIAGKYDPVNRRVTYWDPEVIKLVQSKR